MAPQLAGIYHEPLFQMFLNVRKAYDLLYRTRCMEVLRGYGLGADLQRLLERYWNDQTVVPRAGGYYGQPFKTERGVTQGGPVSSTIFNILVNAVVQATLVEVCGPQEDQHGLRWASGEHGIVFMPMMAESWGETPSGCRVR